MKVGQIVSGYSNEFGITLHQISEINGEQVKIKVSTYEEGHVDYAWAHEQLSLLKQS